MAAELDALLQSGILTLVNITASRNTNTSLPVPRNPLVDQNIYSTGHATDGIARIVLADAHVPVTPKEPAALFTEVRSGLEGGDNGFLDRGLGD